MIFLDTGYYRGLLNTNGPYHDDSLKIRDYLVELNETTVINTTVLVEILNRFSGSSEELIDLFHNLFNQNEVVQLTGEDYLKSLEISEWFNNSINYSDCTIIQTMRVLGIYKIVSFDDGFKKIDMYEVISTV